MNVSSFVSGKSRQLDGKVASDETVTETDAADAPKLARLLTRILRELASLKRRFYPRRTDFEDLTVGSGTTHRLAHGFGGRVRWWLVDSSAVAVLHKLPSTDRDTLVLESTFAAVVTIRVEEAG